MYCIKWLCCFLKDYEIGVGAHLAEYAGTTEYKIVLGILMENEAARLNDLGI